MDHITAAGRSTPAPKTRWYRQLYVWVLTAILIGIVVGWLAPSTRIAMEPIGTTFINAMKMLIGPIVFLTIVGGIASVADLKKVGMTGLKALTYFQVGTTLP
jgi:aerobic C4-dicarboxylate transport protein